MDKKIRWAVVVGVAVAATVATIFVIQKPSSVAVRIGSITPLTGEGATYGAATKRGLDLAAEKINANGGIDGIPIAIIYEDDQMNPRTATNAIQKLTTVDRVPAIIGAFGSSVTLAISPIAEEKKTVLFTASSTADAIRDAGDYVFRNVPPNGAQGKTAADFILLHLRFQNACVLHMNNDYGVSLTSSFRDRFTSLGGDILCTETYNPGTSDFRAQLTKILAKKPQVVFYPGHYQESGLILKQARELGLESTFVGGDGSYSPELLKISGNASEGSYYTLMSMESAGENEQVQEFVTTFKQKYSEEPDVYAAYAYDALLVLAEAIRKGGYSSEGIKSQLYGMSDFKGVTGVTRFDSNGEVDKPYGVYQVKNAIFVPVSWGKGDKP